MNNAGVLSFNSAERELSADSSCCSESEATPPAAPAGRRPRLGRFLDVYSPEHLNLTPKPKSKFIFNQIRNEGPITVTPEKYYESDNEYKCWSIKGERRSRLVYEECSFEGNQSFPRVRRRAANMEPECLAALRGTLDVVRVDGPNGLRFNSVVGGEGSSPGAAAGLQPHCNAGKAVFTIEPHTTKILIVNSAACSLLGYSAEELGGVRLAELVRGGAGLLAAGGLGELARRDGGAVPASLWVRQLEPEGPRLVVAEPVVARRLALTVEAEGGAVRALQPEDAAAVFGADCADRLLGLPVTRLIPSIRLPSPSTATAAGDAPDPISKQKATGRTLDGGCFPLCLWITKPTATAPPPPPWHGKGKENAKEKLLLDVNVRVTYNVSGLLVVDEGGVVSACNPHFARLMFGKHQHEVVGRRVDTLIRHFCRDADLELDVVVVGDNMTLSPLENRTRDRESVSVSESESASEESGGALEETSQRSALTQDPGSSVSTSQRLPDLVSGLEAVSVSEGDATLPRTGGRGGGRRAHAPPPLDLDPDPPGSDETSADFLTPINEMPPPPPDLPDDERLATSTPAAAARGATPAPRAAAGTYRGTALHRDGTELPVVYTVSTVVTAGGQRVRCVWLGVAPPAPAAAPGATPDSSLLLAASSRTSRPHSASLATQPDRDEQLAGDYSKHYVTLKQIGKGAFGCVKMAYRRSDRLLAVTKFILKEKVGAQFWVDAPDGRRLPLEISLLLTLKHPNIVSVMDVFENDKYFQMVMEKHGAGMDLFEFIERRPRLDEPLLSYIFRQICEAVHYLHSLNVLHRDIKDENVIIDDRFHVKLIDFGSAAFRATDGATFGTFYGTTEYCSPEVLAGNRYAGPELEVWAMGVTLYVLAFGVAPFADVEDALAGRVGPPAGRPPPSAGLQAVLRAALHPEPAARATVAGLLRHEWTAQPVAPERYSFPEVVACSASEAQPETHYCATLRSSDDLLGPGSTDRDPTSLSEDATGHAAADIDVDLDSWDECEPEQDSFS